MVLCLEYNGGRVYLNQHNKKFRFYRSNVEGRIEIKIQL